MNKSLSKATSAKSHLNLPKSGAFYAGLDLPILLHDGRHHLLQAHLLLFTQI